jgi:WD40 repeat protein
MTNSSIEPSPNFAYQLGSSIPFDNKSYVTRAADQELYDLLKAREYCFVFNSRQMGKSSLRVRTMFKLRQDGIRCVVIDPQMRGKTIREDQWYAGTIKRLIEDLSLDKQVNFSQWWKELDAQDISVVERFNIFIDQILLHQIIDGDIIIFVEEIDILLSLNFDTDSFFGLIRSWHERRAENPEYQRLTFAFFGVATPYDLILDHKGSPFSFGHEIELNGFQLSEATPLIDGLKGKVADPEAVLKEVLDWTGGQPFLTQKLLKLISREPASTLSITDLVKYVVQNKIITHWESQDVPSHLKTVRDRLLKSGDEQRKGYLLNLYQQILLEGSIIADDSPEQMQLRLTGFVVKHDDRLTIYNQIYRRVFDLEWVKQEIDDLRDPLYAEYFRAWQKAEEGEKDSFLLNKNVLQKAEEWRKGVSHLSEEDNDFLQKSRDKIQQEIQSESEQKLEEEHKAREAAEKANKILEVAVEGANEQAAFGLKLKNNAINQSKEILKKAKKKELSSLIILLTTMFVFTMSLLFAKREIVRQEIKADVLQAESSYLKNNKLDALLQIVKTGKEFQQNAWFIQDKDTESSLLTNLQKFVYEIKEKNQFKGHTLDINSVVFSPDGKTIASGSRDNTVRLWSLDGKPPQTLMGHTDDVISVAFSPDGKTIASGSRDNTVRLWSLDGKPLQTLMGHTDDVISVAFSPDRKTITSGSRDNTMRLWSLDGKPLQTLKGQDAIISSLAFSPDGKTIAIANWNKKTLELWNLDGKLLKSLTKQSINIKSLVFSPNGKTVAAADLENNVKLWNTDGALIKIFRAFNVYKNADIKSLAFSRDEQTIAVASNITSNYGNNQVELWGLNLNSPKRPATLLQTVSGMRSVAFNIDGKTIASGSRDNSVRLWALDAKLPKTLAEVRSVAFNPNGDILSYSDDKTVKLWNQDGKLLKTFQWSNARKLPISNVAFSPDGKIVASGSLDKTVKLWSLDGKLLHTFSGHEKPVDSLAFSPDGKIVASGSRDKTVKLWSLDGKLLHTFSEHENPILSVAFSPDGKIIASGSHDKTVKLWSLDGKLLHTLRGHRKSVDSVAFSREGKIIASGSTDKTVKLWSLDGKLLQTLSGHENPILSVAFSPDEKMVASSSHDKTVKLWSLDGKLLRTLDEHRKPVQSVAFSANEKMIVHSSGDGVIKLSHLALDDLLNDGCRQLTDYLSTNTPDQKTCN